MPREWRAARKMSGMPPAQCCGLRLLWEWTGFEIRQPPLQEEKDAKFRIKWFRNAIGKICARGRLASRQGEGKKLEEGQGEDGGRGSETERKVPKLKDGKREFSGQTELGRVGCKI
mmetsp:Transcript_1264/g.3023  ORF Transcript_1264/g.3023 Transcript_1264/m.3023 type:complete len:116 (+) Transcript_1264:120-467(+)